MKKYWKLIIGIFCIVNGAGTFMSNRSLALYSIFVGFGFFAWHYIQTKKIEKLDAMKEKVLKMKIVGVTTINDDGMSRQELLRKIKSEEPPFDRNKINVTLGTYDYKGRTAVGVFANEKQIGNLPKDQTDYILDHWDEIGKQTKIDVSGGGTDKDGDPINLAADITLTFSRQNAL